MRTFAACIVAFASLAVTVPVTAPVSAQEFTSTQRDVRSDAAIGVIKIGSDLTEKVESYGPREMDRLMIKMEAALMDALLDAGRFAELEPAGSNVLLVVIEDARPNRPTFDQLVTGIEGSAYTRGGARLTATLTDAAGEELRRFAYTSPNSPIDEPRRIAVWTDAEIAFGEFAYMIAGELQEDDRTVEVAASR